MTTPETIGQQLTGIAKTIGEFDRVMHETEMAMAEPFKAHVYCGLCDARIEQPGQTGDLCGRCRTAEDASQAASGNF